MLQLLIYKIKRIYHFFKTGLLKGFLAEIKYKYPSKKIKIITITGTDGKTTSTTMLYHVLKSAGKKVGLLSTVAAYLDDKAIDTGFHVTSPQPDELQKFIAQMVEKKYEYLVLEVTSHGSYQYRDWGINPIASGVTNIAHEHLDYHINYDEYLKAKADILKKAPVAVLNQDDISYLPLKKILQKNDLVTYSKESQIPESVDTAIKKRFKEPYNQMNARLVYTLAKISEISDEDFCQALKTFKGITGRMQEIPNDRKLKIVVDFAHTPQGVDAVLQTLKSSISKKGSTNKLISVIGSAGARDRNKRPVMGKIATDLSDYVVFTAEDPRHEDVWSIIRQMKENLTSNHDKIISIADRGKAIDFAINKLAEKGDTIVVLGKGHEKTMCYLDTEYPWNDIDAVEKILAGKTVSLDPLANNYSKNT